jgi:hypothetical protein
MLNVWRERTAILMMQDHDAITIQYPEAQEDEIIPKILSQLEYPVELSHNRRLVIPYDCQVGWNRAKHSSSNPDGLVDYQGHDKRKRTPEVHMLDRRVR